MNYILGRLVSLIVMVFFPSVVMAFISSVSVTNVSGSNNIPRTESSIVKLRWSMQSFGSSPGNRITSQNGKFIDDAGNILGVNDILLAKSFTPVARVTVTLNETVRIPLGVLYAANRKGLTRITYVRSFTDCPANSCTTQLVLSISFYLTSSSSAAFSVTSYKIRFGNDRVSGVIKQGEELKATAFINVTRTGTIRGVWEVATPTSTAGIPVFRSLRIAQRQLTNFAINPIESPLLPSNATGIYLVRFRFLDPELSGDIPTIQYQVTARTKVLETISLLQPQNGATISGTPIFTWNPVKGVSAYKLEFINAPVTNELSKYINEYVPVAGMMILPENFEAKPNASIVNKLQPGRVYWWHIIGVDDKGQYLAISAWRSVRIK